MLLMVERDRLSGPEANAQTDKEEEYQDPRRQSDKEEFNSMPHLVSIGLSGGSPGSSELDDKQQSLLQ